RAASEDPTGRTSATVSAGSLRAPSDQAVDDLRDLAERCSASPGAQGAPTVRWAYELLAPSAVGLVLLAVLLAVA
ncbi:membrane protein, partial [Streptomyces sp. NRRL B-1568]